MFNAAKLSRAGILGLFIDLEPRLIAAVHRGDEQKVRRLLRAGVSPNAVSRVYRGGSQFSVGYFAGDSALKVAGKSGRLDVVRLLLSAGGTPDSAALAAAGAAVISTSSRSFVVPAAR